MGGKGGVRLGTRRAGGVGCGGDLTLRSPVVGGGDALEALLASCVPPGGRVREVRGGHGGLRAGGWHLLTAAG